MKTWKDAQKEYDRRLQRCKRLYEVILVLQEFKAPAPNDVGAAHLSWCDDIECPEASIDVGMLNINQINFRIRNNVSNIFYTTKSSDLRSHVQTWLDDFRRACPHWFVQ